MNIEKFFTEQADQPSSSPAVAGNFLPCVLPRAPAFALTTTLTTFATVFVVPAVGERGPIPAFPAAACAAVPTAPTAAVSCGISSRPCCFTTFLTATFVFGVGELRGEETFDTVLERCVPGVGLGAPGVGLGVPGEWLGVLGAGEDTDIAGDVTPTAVTFFGEPVNGGVAAFVVVLVWSDVAVVMVWREEERVLWEVGRSCVVLCGVGIGSGGEVREHGH